MSSHIIWSILEDQRKGDDLFSVKPELPFFLMRKPAVQYQSRQTRKIGKKKPAKLYMSNAIHQWMTVQTTQTDTIPLLVRAAVQPLPFSQCPSITSIIFSVCIGPSISVNLSSPKVSWICIFFSAVKRV